MTVISVPELVQQRAMSNGTAGQRWLDGLPEVVGSLVEKWGLELGQSFRGGTAGFVTSATDASGRPCVLKVAMPLDMDEIDSFRRSVLVHRLRSDRAHDLSVPMREYNEPLLAGDTKHLVRERAELLASWCDVDPEPVLQWGFIERVSTGLANVRDFGGDDALVFLEVARRCL